MHFLHCVVQKFCLSFSCTFLSYLDKAKYKAFAVIYRDFENQLRCPNLHVYLVYHKYPTYSTVLSKINQYALLNLVTNSVFILPIKRLRSTSTLIFKGID